MTYKAFLKELGIKLKQQRKKLELNQSELIEKINKGLTKNDDDYLSEKITNNFIFLFIKKKI